MNIIQKINLKNFRCHSNFELDCNRPTTLIIGENGSGKTSVLEAIYLALRGKSFKGTDRDILKHNTDYYRAEIELADAKKIIIRFNGTKKEFEIDGKKSLRLPKKNRYPVVLFEPNNIYLIESSPSRRRDYFDELFRQLFLRIIDDIVDTAEVVNCFNNVVNIDGFIGNANGVRLKDIACLIVRQATTFYMIGVISQVNLCTMIDTTLQPCLFLFSQYCQ